ncbi:NAD-dependent epimerase/dehydratase family protein [Tahibacter amnicola]|uniref:NAD-dependent epimerase/dehydratase family protein n=1 Tax=Tahibacter amnicola TaxID=2976241 RepID=A0ABY6BJ50_9GAMM|nr:NAD-dependent epimerase/dehydratase family protein [Tahibacter amnicola]UXI69125.1 NAD-dependent epimerase/dehydratase family protein [Tahibacter amnicola]
MTRVLLTGATGFLGEHLLRQLVEQGVAVAALHRSDESRDALAALGAEPIQGDLRDPASLAAALAIPTDAIFHAASDASTWRLHNAEQTRNNVDGTANLLAAARESGTRRFVYTSTVAAYGKVEHSALFEALPRLGVESWINYERSMALAELLVRDAGRRGEIETVILAPPRILGPGDRRHWARLIRLIDQGRLPGAPPGSGTFSDVREVARAHIAAWRSGRHDECWLLGGEHATYLDFIRMVADELGRPAPRRATPEAVVRAYARMLDVLSLVTRREPRLTPEAVDMTCRQLRVDCRKAESELDYRKTPLPILIRDTLAWMRSQGMLRPQ